MDHGAVSTNGRTINGVPRTRKSPCALLESLALTLLFIIALLSPHVSHAQPSVVGQSTSTKSTTEGARKSFFDSSSNTHWVFWYNGAAVEYSSSPDGATWTSRGTLAYNTPNFSVTHKVLGSTSYFFLVSEANTYDVVMRRGTLSGTSVSFDSEETVLDGTSASDAYIRPHVVCDTNGKVWTAAFKDLGKVGDRYHLTARRTTNRGDQAISFNAATSMGKPSISVVSVAMVPTGGEKMVAAVSGESGRNVVAYEFNGVAWNQAGAGGEYGTLAFAAPGFNSLVSDLAIDGSDNLYVAGGSAVTKWNGTSWIQLGTQMNNFVFAVAVDKDGNVYAGGTFTTAGGVAANRIAKWNGTSWSPLGTGLSNSPNALTVDESGKVYVGGAFVTAGGVTVNRIAVWDGSSWSALGSGMDNSVLALTLDSSGALYAGGRFTTAGGSSISRIAKWDGSSWSSVGSGMDGDVLAIVADDHGNLYAGGRFTDAGGTPANYVAKWNGSSWSALGDGVDSEINALHIDATGNLYAGGSFNTAGGVATDSVAKWTGSEWVALSAYTNSVVTAFALDSTGKLYAGGQFSTIGGLTTNYIASFDGTSWSALEVGLNGTVHAATFDTTGNLYVGGTFSAAGGIGVNCVAKWNGTSWSALGTGVGLLDSVSALAVDAHGNVYAGGWFSSAGGTLVWNIAKWDGASWSALGDGFVGNVTTMILDADGHLYAGGNFSSTGEVPVSRIAKWDGSTWSALGDGLNFLPNALALDRDGNLYATGAFSTAGGVSASRIAKWNGTLWSALGAGLNYSGNDLEFDSTGNLYVVGTFTTAGGSPANRVARWNGTSWSALGTGLNSTANALTIDSDDNLYVGGIFTSAGGGAANYVAVWNGSSWGSLGTGVTKQVYALTTDSSKTLYVGGSGGLSTIRRIPVANQVAGSEASLIAGDDGTAHLAYIDANNDVMMKSYTSSSATWSAATSIVSGTVSSQATGIYGTTSGLVSWFIEGGTVKYTESTSPYAVWSSPVSVSSTGSPRSISVVNSTGSHSQMLATWNRGGGSAGEVVGSLSGTSPTPTPTPTVTPTPTSTPTPTATPTSTPTFTPTLAAPPPPDIDFGRPGDQPQGPNIVVRGRNVVLSGTGAVGYTVEVQVDGIVVGRIPITSSTGSWTFTLPALAPGYREISTVNVASEVDRSAPSAPVKVVIVAAAPLDFTGVGDTAITTWRRARNEVRVKTRRSSSGAWTTRTIAGRYPAIADYDDDGVSDVAAVGVRDGNLEWNVELSTTGKAVNVSVGAAGDTLVSGCNFAANKGASFAVFKSETRALYFRSLGDSATREVVLSGLGSCNVIGCGDTDGDGVDELLFTTRGADNRTRVVGYDTTGQRRFESKYNSFVRGFVVDRPNSSVPLVAVIGGTERRGRQVKITTMAGSFAFPRFFVERGATIGNGTFTTETNEQVSGIFWANRATRMVSRRLLSRGAETTELFKLPKGYSLVRPQGIIRTEAKH